ncbi:MAG: DUF1491 family protein [Parvibaculum sp.]
MARLKAEIWVKALIRRAAFAGSPAMVVRRGHEEAGTVYVKVNRLDNTASVYAPTWGHDGERVWLCATGAAPVADEVAEAYLGKQFKFDPDVWVVEIEDREGRHFLTEPVEVTAPAIGRGI